MKPRTTWRSRYPGFGRSIGPDRTARTVTAVAAAGLVGTIIGGFSAFGVFSALTPPPRQEAAAAPASPIRTVYGVVPDPSAGMTAGAPVQASATPAQPAEPSAPQQQPAAAPANGPPPMQGQPPQPAQAQSAPAVQTPQKTWPDALSRVHPETADTQAADDATSNDDAANKDASANKDNAAKSDSVAKSDDAGMTQAAVRSEPQRKNVAKRRLVAKPRQRAIEESADDTPRRGAPPVYDYFWGEPASGGAALSGMKPPHTGRAARGDYRRDSYEDRDRGGFSGGNRW